MQNDLLNLFFEDKDAVVGIGGLRVRPEFDRREGWLEAKLGFGRPKNWIARAPRLSGRSGLRLSRRWCCCDEAAALENIEQQGIDQPERTGGDYSEGA